jgi:hypothetical protein
VGHVRVKDDERGDWKLAERKRTERYIRHDGSVGSRYSFAVWCAGGLLQYSAGA